MIKSTIKQHIPECVTVYRDKPQYPSWPAPVRELRCECGFKLTLEKSGRKKFALAACAARYHVFGGTQSTGRTGAPACGDCRLENRAASRRSRRATPKRCASNGARRAQDRPVALEKASGIVARVKFARIHPSRSISRSRSAWSSRLSGATIASGRSARRVCAQCRESCARLSVGDRRASRRGADESRGEKTASPRFA